MSGSLASEGSRQRWIIVSAAFATFMGTLDAYIVNISLPTIAHHFGVDTGQAAWVTLAYLLILTSTMILFGKLADRVGVKKLFLSGYAVFIAGSLLCGLSRWITLLVGARILQAVGGSVLRVVAYALVPKFLPAESRGRGFGTLSMASALGVTIGAPAGGFITSYFSWRWAFLVNVPVGLVAILAVCAALPRDERQAPKGGTFDFAGAAFSFGSLLALIYALNQGQEEGWTSPVILSCFAASAVLGAAFVMRERKHPEPLLDLALFRRRPFALAVCATFSTILFMGGNSFLYPFYLQYGRSLRVDQAGLVLLVYSLVYIPVSFSAGRLADRVRPSSLCGFAMLSASAACLTFVLTMDLPGPVPMFLFIVWAGVSCALFISPNNKQAMGLAPQEAQGSASGVINTVNQLSAVAGVCLFETLFSAPLPSAGGLGLEPGSAPRDGLFTGFRCAYVLAVAACLASATFSLASGRAQRTKGRERAAWAERRLEPGQDRGENAGQQVR